MEMNQSIFKSMLIQLQDLFLNIDKIELNLLGDE